MLCNFPKRFNFTGRGELFLVFFVNPFNRKISLVILLHVNVGHTILMMLYSSENLVLDQLIIPELVFFFILVTYLLDIVLIL